MDEVMERADLEVIELDDNGVDPYTPEKLAGVALLGAVGSLLLYYLYNQLDGEKRERLRESLVTAVKSQVRQWSEES